MTARRPSTRTSSSSTPRVAPRPMAVAATPAVAESRGLSRRRHEPTALDHNGEALSPETVATEATSDSSGIPGFAELGLPRPITKVLAQNGIVAPFPIQQATLPDALAGFDILGRGRTGSGKTLAFALPLLARLAESRTERRPGRPRALILAPTRELASQISDAMEPYAKALNLRTTTIFGGVGAGPQIAALRAGVDVVVACPGRLNDHLQSHHANLDAVEITVLDEADHMADLGFLPVVKKLLDQTPRRGQRMLFSATLDNGIDILVRTYLHQPRTHSVDSEQSPVSTMEHHVLHVRLEDRLPVIVDLAQAPGRTMIFTRTKHGAKKLAKQLVTSGVPAVELHGNLAQNARTRNLAAFGDGTATALVATDIAARGIHVDDVALVIHADPPAEHKAYLHRSGRTARAGADGTVVTMMLDEQVKDVRMLTKQAGISPTTTKVELGHPLLMTLAPGARRFVTPAPQAAPEPQVRSPRPMGNPANRRSGAAPSGASRGRGQAAASGRPSGGPSGAPRRSGRAGGQSGRAR